MYVIYKKTIGEQLKDKIKTRRHTMFLEEGLKVVKTANYCKIICKIQWTMKLKSLIGYFMKLNKQILKFHER